VAAATHPVGSLAHGGSWDLDATVGLAARRAPFTAAVQMDYAGLLQAAPVLANVATTAAYTENAATATVLANALTVSDADSPNLVSATVRISSGFFFGDVLAADVTGTSITRSYNFKKVLAPTNRASGRSRPTFSKAALISRPVLALRTWTCSP